MQRRSSFIASLLAARANARRDQQVQKIRRQREFLKAPIDELEKRQLLTTYYVDNFSDATANTSASNGTLRWAIGQANTHSGADTIQFSSVSWPQTITLTAANGPLSVQDSVAPGNLTILGPGQSNLTISGGNATGLFQVYSNTTISDLTLQNANGVGQLPNGGAIYVLKTNLTLSSVTISNCYGNDGGAVYTDAFAGSGGVVDVAIHNSSISYCSSNPGGLGGAICSDGTSGTAYLSIDNTTIANCSANRGGAIYTNGYSGLANSTLSKVALIYNQADAGGGIFANSISTVNITYSTVAYNNATGYKGGGLYIDQGADLTADHITVALNTSANVGGGLFAYAAGSEVTNLTITNSIVANNTATPVNNLDFLAEGGGAINVNLLYSLYSNIDYTSGVNVSSVNSINSFSGAQFGALGNYGGLTDTLPLLSSSVARGNATSATVGLTDQRGGKFATADMGAYAYGSNIVWNSNNTGDGSLRQAISGVSSISGADVVTFDSAMSGQSITLTSPITINDSSGLLTIDGTTVSSPVTVSGNATNNIFNLSTATTVSNLILTNTTATYNISGNANLTVTGGNISGPVAGTSANIVSLSPASGSIAFGALSATTLTASSPGTITQSSGNLIVSGTGNFVSAGAGGNGNITLGNSTNNFGTFVASGTNITVTDSSGLQFGNVTATGALTANGAASAITQSAGTNLAVTGTANFITTGSGTAGNITLGNSTNNFGTVTACGTNITIYDSSDITIGAITASGDFTVQGVNSTSCIAVTGPVNATGGSGNVTLTGRNIVVTGNINSAAGAINLYGNGGGSYQTGSFDGVCISGSTVNVNTTNGNITIDGRAGGGSNWEGVNLISSSVQAGGSGCVTITGMSGNGSGGTAYGILAFGATVTTSSGSLTVNGTSCGTGSISYGVYLKSSANISATGTGNVTITGTAACGTDHAMGIEIYSSSKVTTSSGSLTVNGTSYGTTTFSRGVQLESSANISATGTGNVTITGSTPGNTSAGVGINYQDSVSKIYSNGGLITLTANSVNLVGSVNATTAGNVLIQTLGAGVNLGNGTDTTANLGLSQTELNQITANLLTIGNSTTGVIVNTAAISRSNNTLGTNLTLISVSSITQTAPGNLTISGTANFVSSGSGTAGNITLGNNTNNFGTVKASGTNITIADSDNITLSDITASGGLTVSGNVNATGITVTGQIQATGSASVSLTGWNILLLNSSIISNSGDILLDSNSGTKTGTFSGIRLGNDYDSPANISTTAGNITLLGRGGNVGGFGRGVAVLGGSIIGGGGAGKTVNITGYAGNSSDSSKGVNLFNSASRIIATGADINIIGYGGANAGDGYSIGVDFQSGNVNTTGAGNISVQGYGNKSAGISIAGNTNITALGSGSISLTGNFVSSSTSIQISSGNVVTNGGNISLISDDITIDTTQATVNATSSGSVVIKPLNAGTAINLGTTISGGEINRITAGCLTIGSASAGNIVVSAAIDRSNSTLGTNLSLISGGTITSTGAGNLVVSGTANFVSSGSGTAGNITLGNNPNNFGTVKACGTNITIYDSSDITIGAITASGDFTVQGVNSTSCIAVTGPVNATGGSGNVTLTGRNIVVTGNINSAAGAINLYGNGGGSYQTGDFDGVCISGSGVNVNTTSGNITIDGRAGGGSVNAGVNLTSSKVQASGSGCVTITGMSGNGSGGNAYGILASGATVTTSSGSLTVNGTSCGTGSGSMGVILLSSANISATGAGNVTITGTAACGTDYACGIIIESSCVTANSGSLTVNGTSCGTGGNLYGVRFNNSNISANGTGPIVINGCVTIPGNGTRIYGVSACGSTSISTSNGDITITGNTVAGLRSAGVNIYGSATVIAGGSGNLAITGIGSSNTTTPGGVRQFGIWLEDSSVLRTDGTGTLTLNGTGGASSSVPTDGIYIDASTANLQVSSGGGAIILNGVNGANSSSFGVNLFDRGNISTTSNITINSNSLNISANSVINASTGGNVVIQTQGAGVNLGDGTDTTANLGLSQAELNQITANVLTIGNTTTGAIVNTDAISRSNATLGTNLTLISGNSITQTGAGNLTISGTANFVSSGSGNSGNITLSNATNNFGTVTASGTNITLNDSNDIAVGAITTTGDFTVQGNSSLSCISVTGPVDATGGSGCVTLNGRNIQVNGNITTASGDIALYGNGGGVYQSGFLFGVYVSNANVTSTSGNISIDGRGASGTAGYGVYFDGSRSIQTGSSGSILMIGLSGNGTSNSAWGIYNGGSVITANGSITLEGTSCGTGSLGIGVLLQSGSLLRATGSGTVNVTGQVASGANDACGIFSSGCITSNTGPINLTGNSSASGSGTIGVEIQSFANTSSIGGGNIAIKGSTPGNTTTGIGIELLHSTAKVYSSGGSIILTANSSNLVGTVNATSSGNVFIYTLGAGVNLGNGTDTTANLGLSQTELNQITANLLTIGNSTTGAIVNTDAISRTGNLTLVSGNSITQSGAGNLTITGTASFISGGSGANGNITLSNATNDFDTVVASGTNITLRDANNITLGAIVPSGDLRVTGGNITITTDISNAGQLQSYTGAVINSGGSRTLTAANVNLSSSYSGADAALTINGNANITGAIGNVTDVAVSGNAIFGGTVGISGTVNTLHVSGTTQLNGNVTTATTQAYDGALTLVGTRTLTGSTITAGSSVTGDNNALTITGNANATGAVGNISDLSVSVNANFVSTVGVSGTVGTVHVSGTTRLAGNVTTTTTQAYDSALTLVGTRTLTGSTITAGGSVTGDDNALTITGNANTTGAVGNVTDFLVTGNANFVSTVGVSGTVNSLHVTGTTRLADNISTTAAQDFDGAATIAGAAVLASSGGSNITFGGTVDGGNSLTVNTAGRTKFTGIVGGTIPLASLTTNAGGTTVLSGNATTTGVQAYNDNATLGGNYATTNAGFNVGGTTTLAANTTVSTGSGAVTFTGAVNGGQSLTVNSTGVTTFSAAVGNSTALTSLTTNAGGSTTISANITTTGTQNFNDSVYLGGHASLATTNSDINFGGSVNNNYKLGLAVGTGNIVFSGPVGNATSLNNITITSANVVSASSTVRATNFLLNGGDLPIGTAFTTNLLVDGGTARILSAGSLTGNANLVTGSLSSANLITGTLDVNGGTANMQTGAVTGGLATLAGGNLTSNAAFNGGLTATGGTLYTLHNGTTTTNLNFGAASVWNTNGTSLADFGVITANGGVTIASGANLTLAVPPMLCNQSITLINKTGSGAVSGSFIGLAQGTYFTRSGMPLAITYTGGPGSNDVIVTDTPRIMIITGGNNQTAASGAQFGSNMTIQVMGGAANETPVNGANVIFQLPVQLSNCNIASGYFNSVNNVANLTANILTDSNGNAAISLSAGVNSGPFNIQPVVNDFRGVYNTYNLGVVGLAVQKQSINRSNVRYLDLVLSDPASIPDLTALNSNIVLQKVKSASLTGGANITPVNLTLTATNAVKTTVGWMFDFGAAGIGGNGVDTTTDDGVYQFANATSPSVGLPGTYQFHRLLGDVNGDKVVDAADTALVNSLVTTLAWRYNNANTPIPQGSLFYVASNAWAGDANGDGRVNATDINITGRWRGRKVTY